VLEGERNLNHRGVPLPAQRQSRSAPELRDLRRACARLFRWKGKKQAINVLFPPLVMSLSDLSSGTSSEAEFSGGLSDPNSMHYRRRRNVLDIVNTLQSHG
jgi:hypothetical protein